MTDMMNGTDVCANTQLIKEQRNCHLYKVGYIELSSYCQEISSSLREIVSLINNEDMMRVSLCINSMGLGLGFVLEDIKEIDRRLSTG